MTTTRATANVDIPYGVDGNGNELVWRPAIDADLMVIGSPGTGKTVLEHTGTGEPS